MENKATFIDSYITPREDIIKLIPQTAIKILDAGCSTGSLGRALKNHKQAEVVGIEVDPKMASVAKKNIDRVIIGDLDVLDITNEYKNEYFDCIIFGDSLEHLKDPWKILKNLTPLLRKDGVVIISIPNVQHYSTFINVFIKGFWPYNERGVHDKTHLRWFTLKNIRELLRQADLQEKKIKRKYRIIEKSSHINIVSPLFAIPPFRNILTHQYLLVAVKRSIA